MTPDEAAAYLTRTDDRFRLTDAAIRGVRYPVFRNAPPHLRALLQSAASGYEPQDDLLVYQDERWSYAAFCSEVNRVSNALAGDLGVRPGDRVALAMRNYPELPILILATAAVGAVAVPMNAWWSEQELAYALEDSAAHVVFADGPRYQRIQPSVSRLGLQLFAVRDAEGPLTYAGLRDGARDADWPRVPIDPDDDFAVLYSSGSTGHPKGVVLTHRGALSAVYSWLLTRAMAPLLDNATPPASPRPPSWLVLTPLFHVTALHSNFLQGLGAGAKIVLLYKWDPADAVRVIDKERVTRFNGVPTQSAELMEVARRSGAALESLEFIGGGGAKRPGAQVGELADAFPGVALASGWGMTETNSLGITIAGPDYIAHPEAAGRPTPPLQEMRIVDDDGHPLPPGQVGELTMKSPANMRGYLNQPEATREALRDGWLYTGDLAYVDDNGLVYIVDRKSSMIIRGGENISCLDVEGALHRHRAVAEACAFPVPDERLGEIVGAGVLLKPGATVTQEHLREFLCRHVASFKMPERIWFRTEPLPRGATGKIDRRTLRDECLARQDTASSQPS